MWKFELQLAFATRKLRTPESPKLNTRVPQSRCSPLRVGVP
jgi:hypothetical protein